MADTKARAPTSGPLSSFMTQQQISELRLSGEKFAKVYRPNSPFFKLPIGVNPEAEILEFFETNCASEGRRILYAGWWQGSKKNYTKYDVTFGRASSGGCEKVRLSKSAASEGTFEKHLTALQDNLTILSGFGQEKGTKNHRFEARLIKNQLGELVEIVVFRDQRIRTSLGQLGQDLTGGTRRPEWDSTTIFQYNFVLGLGYLY